MKHLDHQANEATNGKFFSVKMKWSIGTGIGVVIVFAIFSILLFKSFTGLLLKQEQQYAINAMNATVTRLAQQNKPLTEKAVDELFNYQPAKGIKRTIKSPYQDTVFTSLSQKNIGVCMFNPQGQKVYTSRDVLTNTNGLLTRHKTTTVKKVGGNTVIILDAPLKAKKTGKLLGYVQVTNRLTEYDSTKYKLIFIFIILGVTAGLLSALIGYFLSSWLLQPIEDINETIDKINMTKDSDPFADIRVPKINHNDELSQLAELFNAMLNRMERYIVQQQQFVEDVSHELRTPVAIIQGHLELLNRWGKDDPQVLEESIASSLQEITRMKSLVQEMLDLSRAEQVEIQFGNEITNVGEICSQVFNNMQMIHPDFSFVFDNEIRETTYVQMYRNHLEQVLIILMDNAVKYSTDRKEVHMALGTTADMVEIAIQDFGEGISRENIEKVFNRFYRVDKARSRDKGGNGLGLAIADRLIEGYHGDLSVDSVEGQGSVFRIVLPIAPEKDDYYL